MSLVSPITLAGFIVAYTIMVAVSAVSIGVNDAGVGIELINNTFSSEVVSVDAGVLEATNPLDAVVEVPKTASNNFSLLLRALAFQAPIWGYSWAQPIAVTIGSIMVAYIIALGFFGIGLVLRILGR